jgi:dimeric dUTPase (all-alpha-NTP-PPase superfamily)
MIKLSDSIWNVEVVKELSFEEFRLKVEHFVNIGKLLKCSDSEIRKFYETLTDKKVEPLKK